MATSKKKLGKKTLKKKKASTTIKKTKVNKKEINVNKKKLLVKTNTQKSRLLNVKRPIINEGDMPVHIDTIRELAVGDFAPEFSLPSTMGTMVSLSALKGKKVVLYFYPKDMTSGCTLEAKEFSSLVQKFSDEGILLFGISPDTIDSHHKFIEKEGITFPLLSDPEHFIASMYGVWVKKSMYGREYMGIERSTFVVDPQGKLEAIYRKVSAAGHAVCVLNDLSFK